MSADERLKPQILTVLQELAILLIENGERHGARFITRTLEITYGTSEFWQEVASNNIWAGSGSLFDQAFVDGPYLAREEFYRLLLQLGTLLGEAGQATAFVSSATSVLRQLIS